MSVGLALAVGLVVGWTLSVVTLRTVRRMMKSPEGFGADVRSKWIGTMEHEDLLRLRNAVAAEIHRRTVT